MKRVGKTESSDWQSRW